MAKADECLFLLEVLIDKVIFIKSPCFSDKDFKTCVSFEFLSLAPLVICDDDGSACSGSSGGPYVKDFNSGKSCLFALKQPDIDKAMQGFPMMVTVYKSLPCDCLPTKVIMGTCTIDVTKEFAEARKKYIADPDSVSSESKKDAFRLTAPDKSDTGDLLLFLRISCFGKIIITKFQGTDGATKPICDGGGKSKSCNPKKEFRNVDDPCSCGGGSRGGRGGGGCSSGGNSITEATTPCQDPDDPCYCSGPPQSAAARSPVACRNTEAYCLHVPKGGCCPSGNRIVFQVPEDNCAAGHRTTAHLKYNTTEGVGDICREDPCDTQAPSRTGKPPTAICEFDDQVIKLKVRKYCEMPDRKTNFELQFFTPKGHKLPEIPSKDTRESQCDPTKSKKGSKKKKCGPKQLSRGKPFEEIGAIFNGNEVKIRVPKSTRKVKNLTPSEEAMQNRCTCDGDLGMCPPTCGGGELGPGGARNQMIFQMPDDMCGASEQRTAQNSELVYSRREQPGVACDVTPAGAPAGVSARKMMHPNKDVFVLQIGKATDEPGRDGNIEVELVTPRDPSPQKLPPHSCKQVQVELEPAKSAPSKRKKGSAGKKGKRPQVKVHSCSTLDDHEEH